MNSHEQKKSSTQPSTEKQDGIVDQAKHAMTNVAGQAREQVTHELDVRKENAVDKIGDVATAIRETSEKLKDIGPLGDLAGRAADGIDRVTSFFEDRKVTDIVRDVERFARREPAIFLGAALAVGLLGGRFLKSSSHRARREEGEGGDRLGGGADDREKSFSSPDYASKRYGQDQGGYKSQSFASRDPYRDTLPMGSRPAPTPPAPLKSSAAGGIKPSAIVNASPQPTGTSPMPTTPGSAGASTPPASTTTSSGPSSSSGPPNGSTGRV